jgi:hypothetical protein
MGAMDRKDVLPAGIARSGCLVYPSIASIGARFCNGCVLSGVDEEAYINAGAPSSATCPVHGPSSGDR